MTPPSAMATIIFVPRVTGQAGRTFKSIPSGTPVVASRLSKCHWVKPGRRAKAKNRKPGDLPRAVVLFLAGVRQGPRVTVETALLESSRGVLCLHYLNAFAGRLLNPKQE